MGQTKSARSDTAQGPGAREPAGLSRRQLDDALAAEFVLGLVDAEERAEATRRLQQDPEFAAMVARWQARMGGTGIGKAERRAKIALPGRALPRQPRSVIANVTGALGFVAGAVVGLVLVLATIAIFAQPKGGVIARLTAPDNRLSYEIATYGQVLQITRVAGKAPPRGTVHHLWLLRAGKGPLSLGVLSAKTVVIDYAAPLAGSRFAISLEADNDSAGTSPLGPLILAAQVID